MSMFDCVEILSEGVLRAVRIGNGGRGGGGCGCGGILHGDS